MDVVVTLPESFGLSRWIAEGDAAGDPWSGQLWAWYLGGRPPNKINIGERVYVVYKNHLIGYSRLIRIDIFNENRYSLVRAGDAMAATIDQEIKGFRGFRYRWWDQNEERLFPEWRSL